MIQIENKNVSKIIEAICAGKVVALPTETVYGLAISLNSPSALEKLIYLKRREINSGKIFTLVPKEKTDFSLFAKTTKETEKLINKYVPGEITFILPKNPNFRHPYFDHFNTIGLRIPNHPLFREILKITGPLLLTSANPRGDTPAITSEEVEKSLPKVDALVLGKSNGNPPSTILDCTQTPPKILREGSLKLNF